MAGFSNHNPAGLRNGNGKRERNDQEDDQEFMPLSKRINNIHLSPERLVNGQRQHSTLNGYAQAQHQHQHPEVRPGPSASMNPHHLNGHPHPNQFHPNTNGFQEANMSSLHHPTNYEQQAHNFHQRLHQAHHSEIDINTLRSNLPSVSSSNPAHRDSLHVPHPHTVHSHISAENAGGGSSSFNSSQEYRPSLSQNDNPHYYEANRTLFDLYLERMSRHNQNPHPHLYNRT